MNPYKDVEESSFSASTHLTYEDIATKLLKENFFLTALELHTELVESGKELPQLREFFSNPGNFEQHVTRPMDFTSMHRTPSQATLDSLDTARYSEDGGGDRGGSGGDVAVLEFELRKARETINSLRANLTQFVDGESALDKNLKDSFDQRSLKPHEKRALNFLINEYLLLQNYKLTSITFSDENPDQEFEDWDDVGLNMPRPANLIALFWGNTPNLNLPKVDATTGTEKLTTDAECQTDFDDSNVCVSCQTLDLDTDWNHEFLIQAEEIELLKQKIIALETEKLNFQKLYDAALVSLNSLTSPTSENKGLELKIPVDKMPNAQQNLEQAGESKPLTNNALENHYGSGHSTHSGTPEQFEMVYSDRPDNTVKKGESSHAESVRDSPVRRDSVTTLDETLSINDGSEWTPVQYDESTSEYSTEKWINSVPNNLKETILDWCFESFDLSESSSNDLLSGLCSCEKPITLEELLPLVADTLPRILPHTLVARRSEAAALLAAATILLPAGDNRRTRLLHFLLTLYRKPDPPDTKIICEATTLVVKWGGSGEVLSSIAELLTSKSVDRRLFASQVCLTIAPFVPIELCTSLLLSLVTVMCESSDPEIRIVGLKSACLICPVAENKYEQLENILFNFLEDPVEKIVNNAVSIFLPILARSALSVGKFSCELYSKVMANLANACAENETKTLILYLHILRELAVPILAYVLNVRLIKETKMRNTDIQVLSVDNPRVHTFVDIECYLPTDMGLKLLLASMNDLFNSKTKKKVRWPELNWFVNVTMQTLEIAFKCKAVHDSTIYELFINLFSDYVKHFRVEFATYVLHPMFMEMIGKLESKLEKLDTLNVDCVVIVGIYFITISIAIDFTIKPEDFLQKWILYSSIRNLPVKMFSVPLKWLASNEPQKFFKYMEKIRHFAVKSHENASGNAIRTYIANLINELLNQSEIEEECIEEQILPVISMLLYDKDAGARETAITAWGSLTRICIDRGSTSQEDCWQTFETTMSNAKLTGREGIRAAESLALLMLPAVDSHVVSERAVLLLCGLCNNPDVVRNSASALAPALQLAVHHCAYHPALGPALRQVEMAAQTSLPQYKPAIDALLHASGTSEVLSDPSPRPSSNLQAAQEVGRRVTQIFQQSKTNMNLQNIFKKKT